MPVLVTVGDTFGAYMLGTFVSSMLLGGTYIQAYNYFNTYADGPLLKSLVVAVTAFETIHVGLSIHAVYYLLVVNHSSPLSLHHSLWSVNIQFGIIAMVMLAVQLFYARRIYLVGEARSLFIPIIIVILSMTHFASSWILVAFLFLRRNFTLPGYPRTLAKVAVSSALSVDAIIAVTLSLSLHKRRTGIKQTNQIINRLILYIINNGILTTTVEMLTLALLTARPEDMTSFEFSQTLASLYTNSFLATLNHRRHPRHTTRGRTVISHAGDPSDLELESKLASIRFRQLDEVGGESESESTAASDVVRHRTPAEVHEMRSSASDQERLGLGLGLNSIKKEDAVGVNVDVDVPVTPL